ncbi:MAG: hypothetical protein J6Y48_19430, partial [Clostridia bacterium]|nr:hypothetical protein [Clostridia bacterium]
SAELLAMAGLSAQDVQNMIAAAPASGGGGGGPSGSSNNNNNNNQNTSSWLNNMFVNGMNNVVDTLNSGLNSIGWFNFLNHMVNGEDPTKPGIK